MYDHEFEKTKFKLTADASSMGYAVFLKSEFINGLNFEDEQRAQVWMNTFIVQLIQIFLLAGCFYFASYYDAFVVYPAQGLDLVCGRFLASMLMHINVERDVKVGLNMMKYALNHRENFTNLYPAFFVGFL